MKMIIGLGNPGPEYAKTRHNAGFMVVDRLWACHARGEVARGRFQSATVEATISGEKCLLMKPTTFMNLSGRAVADAIRFYKADPAADVLVVVDDLYLPVGKVRVRPGGGTGGHNGLESIEQALGRDDYPRLRVGVGLSPSGGKPPLMDQADFVVSRFTREEEEMLEPALARAARAAEAFVAGGLARCMNVYNADPREQRGPEDQGAARPPEQKKTDPGGPGGTKGT